MRRGRVVRLRAGHRRPAAARPSSILTIIRLARGFGFLVAILDWYSRKVLSWRVSNTIDTRFCVDALEDAL